MNRRQFIKTLLASGATLALPDYMLEQLEPRKVYVDMGRKITRPPRVGDKIRIDGVEYWITYLANMHPQIILTTPAS